MLTADSNVEGADVSKHADEKRRKARKIPLTRFTPHSLPPPLHCIADAPISPRRQFALACNLNSPNLGSR